MSESDLLEKSGASPGIGIFDNPGLVAIDADEAAMTWQDEYEKQPSEELRAKLGRYAEWKQAKGQRLFSHADMLISQKRAARENRMLTEWQVMGNDAGMDHVARERGFIGRYEEMARTVPREKLRPQVARDLFVQDITGATPEQLATGVPQLHVAKSVLKLEDASDAAFDTAMAGYIAGLVKQRDWTEKMAEEGMKQAVTGKEIPWEERKAEMRAQGLTQEQIQRAGSVISQTRYRATRKLGDAIPLARRIFATMAREEGVEVEGFEPFESPYRAAEALGFLPEEQFPQVIYAMKLLAEEHGRPVEGVMNKLATSLDRGSETYGVNLGTFMRGRQAQEFLDRIAAGEDIYVPVDEARTPRDAVHSAFGNLAIGQGIGAYGLHADAGKERRKLKPMERAMMGQLMNHLKREQKAVHIVNNYRSAIAEVKSENLLAQGLYDATESLPYTGMAFLGPVGMMANGAVMAEDNFRELQARYPGLDDGTLRNVADLAAVPQAVIERFQARTLFGKFPGAQGVLARLSGGGLLKRVMVIQGMEFSQEMVQGAMLPVAQELLSAIDADVPEIGLLDALGDQVRESPRVFFATLPLSVIGAGGGKVADRFRRNHLETLMEDVKGMRMAGLTEEEAEAVSAAGTLEESIDLYHRTWKSKTPEERRGNSRLAEEAAGQDRALPVMRPRSDGKLEIVYPEGRGETVDSEEEGVLAQEAWLRDHFEKKRQLSQRAIADMGAAFDEELARYDAARPGVSRTEITPQTLGDLRRRGAVTISQAWQRVKDYAAQSGASLEGFSPADFDRFAVKGTASAEARFAGGVLRGAIQLVKGEKDVATLWEEQAETWMHAQLNAGGKWTEADLLDELRRVEVQTGKKFLAGETRANLIEGFSHVARNYAAGNYADLNFGEKLKHFLNLLAEKMAAVFTLAGDLKKLSADGRLSPELETALKESLGFGGEGEAAAEAKYEGDRSGMAMPEGFGKLFGELATGGGSLRLSQSFSINREEALKLRSEIERQVPLTASTQGIATGMTAKEAVQWAKRQGADGTTSHPEIGEIGISTRGIKNAIGHLLNPRKAAALVKMKELIPSSKLIHRHVRAGRPDSYRLAGRIDIDGVEYVARIIVDTDGNGNRFYNHELSDLQELRQTKGPQTLIPGVDPKDQQIGVEELEDTGNLLRWIFSVKNDGDGTGKSFSIGESGGDPRARDEFVHKVWSALAKHDELFQYGRTTSKDAAEIAKAVSLPGMEVTAYRDGNSIFFHGKRGYVEIMDPDSERPYISSPRAKSQGVEKGGGSQLYMAALDWIHNNGKKVADDPDGISAINAKRRTSNFFASALRWGTTRHLEPHADQKVEGWDEDETSNFAALASREMENVFEAIPEARGWTFNFVSARFEHGDGRAVTREEITTAVAGGIPGESGIGFSTVQRALLTSSAVREMERGTDRTSLERAISARPESVEAVSYSIGPVPSFIQPLEGGTQSHERNTREEDLRNPARILAGLEGRSGEDERRIGEGFPAGDEPRGSLRADDRKRRKSGREVLTSARLRTWAEDSGRSLRSEGIANLIGEQSPRGGEHLVIPDAATGRVVKLTKPGFFGAQAEDAGAYLERWALHNIVFSDDVAFEGLVTFPGEDGPRAVISQKFAAGRDATPDEQSDYLKERGFHEVENGRWVHPVRGVVVWDTITPGNCIMTAEGVKVIDLQIGLATTEEIEEVRKQTGIGKRSSF